MALKACNQAYKLSGNNPDGELKAVYGRIRKEKPELFQD